MNLGCLSRFSWLVASSHSGNTGNPEQAKALNRTLEAEPSQPPQPTEAHSLQQGQLKFQGKQLPGLAGCGPRAWEWWWMWKGHLWDARRAAHWAWGTAAALGAAVLGAGSQLGTTHSIPGTELALELSLAGTGQALAVPGAALLLSHPEGPGRTPQQQQQLQRALHQGMDGLPGSSPTSSSRISKLELNPNPP